MKQIPAFRFERDALQELAERYSAEFQSNQPFPHVVIPNFLPEDLARSLAAEFPAPADIRWKLEGPGDSKHTHDPNVEKIGCSDETQFPPLIRHMMHEFNSGVFLAFVQQLTGFENLVPDPVFRGCGLHSTGRGGRLMVHADASRHPNPKFDQILNMIYYVTPDWQSEWGGQLELWKSDMSVCEKSVSPSFNSMLIFFTGDKCFHGHPHPIESPLGVRRNSMAVYYYTTDRVNDETYDGYKNFVQWKRTTTHDRQVTMTHRVKSAVRRYLPVRAVNALAGFVRKVKPRPTRKAS